VTSQESAAAGTFALAGRRVVRFGAVYAAVAALTGVLGLAGLALRVGGILVLIAGVVAARARIGRATGHPGLAARPQLITSDDWDASKWDPEVLRDIERRRGPGG
jgi:hypothetical protein